MTIEQLCDFNNMRNKIREMLIDNYQGLHLIRQGLWHWLNVLGQSFFFSKEENSIIRDSAGKEADLLIVPVNQGMSTDELAATTAIHAFPFWFFIVLDNQSDAAKHFKATRRNYPSFYDSWVYIHWQIRIAQRHQSLLIERICANPVAQNTIRILVEETEQAAYESLKNLIMKEVKFGIPVDEKESLIDFLLGKRIAKLREMPFEKLCHEAFFTDSVIKTDFIDEWRTQHTQGRYPGGGTEYLDAEIKKDGRKVSTLEFLEGKHESLQTQPMDIRSQLTASQKKALRDFLSDTEVKILETLYNYPDFTQEEVAEYVGCTQSKVSKAQRKFEQFKEKIKKILEI